MSKCRKYSSPIQDYCVSSQYFAPRGKQRLLALGEQISQRHLSYNDRLIGFIGDAGSGKSSLIKGMFPGLELSNDDDILNPMKIMEIRSGLENPREASTYHLDIRFQMAFTQMYEIVEYVQSLLDKGKRLVIEHFNLLYPALGRNADIIIGIGEEIIVSRPTLFGPIPQSIYDIVHTSLKYRKMAHSAEEITELSLKELFGYYHGDFFSSDIRNGFVLCFYEKPEIDFDRLEAKIFEWIEKDASISYHDEDHIQLADIVIPCLGPRIHVKSTGMIRNFKLVKRLIYDPKKEAYCLIGTINSEYEEEVELENRNTLYFLKRKD